MTQRCAWVGNDSAYTNYHDTEWGVPVHNDRIHFEFLILEGAQAGLSWITILKRRAGYRSAYLGFDPSKVAKFGDDQIERLLNDDGIVRNKLKIKSSIKNAQVFLDIQKQYGSFDKYIWGFVSGKPTVNKVTSLADLPAFTDLSDTISKDLKSRGMSFVGSTIIYAHLQATGLVNDHELTCFRYNEVMEEAQTA